MSRCVVLLPGARYATEAPLLWFSRSAARARGWEVVEQRELLGEEPGDPFAWTIGKAERALDRAGDAHTAAVIGKSLASAAAGLAADRRLPAAWLTPLLIDDRVVDGLSHASAPTLLVGSAADDTWDSSRIPDNDSIEVLELEGLDHGLERPGDPIGSLEALTSVTERVGDFLDRL
jgi:hypothetical protein